MTNNVNQFAIPSSPEDLKKIEAALSEASDSLIRIEAERDHIKDIVENIKENFNIPKKHITKMIKVYHQNNFDEVTAEQNTFEVLFESVKNAKKV
jgi:archaellum component FlaC